MAAVGKESMPFTQFVHPKIHPKCVSAISWRVCYMDYFSFELQNLARSGENVLPTFFVSKKRVKNLSE